MSEQNWEQGRQLAIARSLREAVVDQYKNSDHFYGVVQDWIEEYWQPAIKPLPLTEEIRQLMDTLVTAIEARETTREGGDRRE